MERWLSRNDDDVLIPSTNRQNRAALKDHMPEVIRELVKFLRQEDSLSTHDQLDHNAEIHGVQRWLQGYSINEVLLEIEKFRKILMTEIIDEFSETQSTFKPAELREIEHSTYDFFRQLIVRSVVKYSESNVANLNDANQKLSQANDDLRKLNIRLQLEEAKSQSLSLTDSLTGVANRRRFESQLKDDVQHSHRYGSTVTVVMIDLDHFKLVNDEFGHETGDKVLAISAAIFVRICRETDFVARIGGDEFVILLRDTAISAAESVISRIRVEMNTTVTAPMIHGVSGSFGIAQISDKDTPATLLSRADSAMYKVKKTGGNGQEIGQVLGRP